MRKTLTLALVLLALIIINISIYNKEKLLKNGQRVYIPTVPVDPRSIMQGDYHILRYRIPATISSIRTKIPRKGFLVLTLDNKKVATITRIHKSGDPLTDNERLIQYRIRSKSIRIGAESFFFQEGHGKYYSRAKYGEFRLDSNGHSLLVALSDGDLNKLGPPKIK